MVKSLYLFGFAITLSCVSTVNAQDSADQFSPFLGAIANTNISPLDQIDGRNDPAAYTFDDFTAPTKHKIQVSFMGENASNEAVRYVLMTANDNPDAVYIVRVAGADVLSRLRGKMTAAMDMADLAPFVELRYFERKGNGIRFDVYLPKVQEGSVHSTNSAPVLWAVPLKG